MSDPNLPQSFMERPSGLATRGSTLWVSDTAHHRILELTLHENGSRSHATLERAWGNERGLRDERDDVSFDSPTALRLSGERLLVADTGNHALRSIDLVTGEVAILAGTGNRATGGISYGSAKQVALLEPRGIAVLEDLTLVSMQSANQIWLLTDDVLGRFAGTGEAGRADGEPGESLFNGPAGLDLGDGVLWVADAKGNAIRRINLTGTPQVTTVAGDAAGSAGDRDGTGLEALLRFPLDVAVAGDRLMIADTGNHRIRLLHPETLEVITIAGSGVPGRSDGLLMQIELSEPSAVAMNGTTLLIADTGNNRIVRADLTTLEASTLFITSDAALDPFVS